MKILQANKKYRDILEKKSKREIITEIVIKNPVINNNGFEVVLIESINDEINEFTLFVKTDIDGMAVNHDQIAYILAALCRHKYNTIKFDFEISEQTRDDIFKRTKSGISARKFSKSKQSFKGRESFSLNLSGGIDSATLYELCPELIPISIDFTAGKQDEIAAKKIYSKLKSNIIVTNASEFLFPHFSNGYYNLGSLLLADVKKIAASANSKLMTDDIETLRFLKDKNNKLSVLEEREIYGVETLYPFLGLTKVGVKNILYKLNPDLYEELMSDWFNENLKDAFTNNSARPARVRLLLDGIVRQDIRDIEDYLLPTFSFNDNIIYTLYIIKKLGIETAKRYIDDIPDNVYPALDSFDMDFMEKYDQQFLEYLPKKFRKYFVSCLEKANVEFYSEKDYAERKTMLDLMGI